MCGGEKSLILFFKYYFIFIPFLLIQEGENENDIINYFNNNINIEFIFLKSIYLLIYQTIERLLKAYYAAI